MAEGSERNRMKIDELLLKMLACPACDDRPPLRYEDNEEEWLVCDKCTRRYPIRDGLPEVLVEAAVLPNTKEK